ncbi:hypothetical protein L3Y34_014217 [Caenorhabditis briggsae]|nr:hypothetical protein L3Y34_014217 [Caenorhabditis briggsae]
MRPVVGAGDVTKLATLFDDEFKFWMCNGKTEGRAAVIEVIGKSPIAVSLNLVSSRFQSREHIYLTVDISAGFIGTWRTVFLLDLTKNVLIGGKLLTC